MAVVALTVSDTLDGAPVSDTLQGGGDGIDLGQVTNNSFSPIVSKAANTGARNLYISHDATVDPITDCKTFIQQYGLGTLFAYGGNDSAANDYATFVALGFNSGSSKNNGDGLSGGLWIDMDWDAVAANQFDQANFPTVVKIYGDNNTDGIDLASAFPIAAAAMVYDAPGETSPSAPVAGTIGRAGDPATLGDSAHVKLRMYLPENHIEGGYTQVEWVVAYSYTA